MGEASASVVGKILWNGSTDIEGLLEPTEAIHDEEDRARVVRNVFASTSERLFGTEVFLHSHLANWPTPDGSASTNRKPNAYDAEEGNDFDNGEEVVCPDTTLAPRAVENAREGQRGNGEESDGSSVLLEVRSGHDVDAEGDGVAS